MAESDNELFIFAIAFGTRGDIVPVLTVLHEVLCSTNNASTSHVRVVTHSCFVQDIRTYLPDRADVVGINTPPILINNRSDREFRDTSELDEILKTLESKKVDVIVSNLFGLEAWSLALKKNTPYVVVHPNLPKANESTKLELLEHFGASFESEYSLLCNRCDKTAGLHLSDFDLWLWPTIVDLDAEMASRIVAYDKSVTVLILSSPIFERDSLWTNPSRYHLCGFISDGHLSDSLHLQVNDTPNHYEVKQYPASNRCIVCHSLEELLNYTHIGTHETSNLICVDLGSMTHVLLESGELSLLLRLLCALCDTWRFVIVCHGLMASIYDIVQTTIGVGNSAESETSIIANNPGIFLMPNSVDHRLLFPNCITVLHHGGIGTTGACMRAGIPQLILSVMYDQHSNGERIAELQLGITYPMNSIVQTTVATEVSASAQRLRSALTACTSAARRLRCACLGRKMRTDPAEDGVRNAVAILREQVDILLSLKLKENKRDESSFQEFVYSVDSEGLLELPNGLKIHAHWEDAPEETVFLYEEIFEREVYARSVAQLKPGDLAVDIGANIGMFALYVARHTRGAHTCSTDTFPPPVQIVCVEPMQASYKLLQNNNRLHNVRARTYRCAVGTTSTATNLDADSARIEYISDIRELPINTKRMLYYPRMPGNSCNTAHIASNIALQEAHMNRNVLKAAQKNGREEQCIVFALSEILEDCINDAPALRVEKDTFLVDCGHIVGKKRPANDAPETVPRVALLKIDVEGDELEVLQSIRMEHWLKIDRVIVESHPLNAEAIQALLQQAGFDNSKITIEQDHTGNSLIFAFRF